MTATSTAAAGLGTADLDGRRVLLVGTGGIGGAVAHRLADRGARIFGTYHANPDAGHGLAAALPDGAWAGQSQLDATDAARAGALAGPDGEAARALGGPADTVVVTTGHRHDLQLLKDQDPQTGEEILRTELLGPITVVRAALPGLLGSGFGRIVLIGSDSGKAGTLGDSVSSAARAGLMGFVRSVARETARKDITANIVSPGPTDTGMLHGMLEAEGLTGKVMGGTLRAVPKGRMGDTAEIAEAVAYFVGPRSGFTTGQVLSVSGGLTMS